MKLKIDLAEEIATATGEPMRNGDLGEVMQRAMVAALNLRGKLTPDQVDRLRNYPATDAALVDSLVKAAENSPILTIGDALLAACDYIPTDDDGKVTKSLSREERRTRSALLRLVRDADDDKLECSGIEADALIGLAEARWSGGGGDFVILMRVTDAIEDARDATKVAEAKASAPEPVEEAAQ